MSLNLHLRRLTVRAVVLAISCCLSASGYSNPPRPNIVFFYADDLGYGDLGCYESEIAQSPRLDRLAKEGTRFTKFYVSHCVCSPTRTSAITGQFPGRHRIYGHLSFFKANEARHMPNWLNVDAPSFPRALQHAGYRAAMIGKWHLGGGSGRSFRISDLKTPGIDTSGRTEVVVNHPDAPPVVDYGFHYSRTTAGNGPTWKEGQLWPEAHDIYPYSDQTWLTWSSKIVADDAINFLERHADQHAQTPFYMNVWFKDVHTPFKPTNEMLQPFLHLDKKTQEHYAMVKFMDSQIERVLDALDRLKLDKNTMIIFSSDNGASPKRGGSNGALRGWKHTLYEGGIRVPLIVRWPEGGVKAGRVDDTSVLNICDFVPTFCKLCGAEMPADYVSDGEDMLAAFKGAQFTREKPQFWHYPTSQPSLAVRHTNWKLLTKLDGSAAQLYNLIVDKSEQDNVAKQHPQRVATMQAMLQDWYRQLPISQK